jgi:hypothetical protein
MPVLILPAKAKRIGTHGGERQQQSHAQRAISQDQGLGSLLTNVDRQCARPRARKRAVAARAHTGPVARIPDSRIPAAPGLRRDVVGV